MPRKKVDERIRTLLSNCVKKHERSLIVLVGDAGKDQVVNLHHMMSKLQVKARPSVLWCYKKELGFSTHKKKRMRQIKKMVQRGLYDPEKDDPFELFVASTNIRWAYYRDSEKVLGQTFGMCVLQDFEALTPNLLARTVETVEGGGTIVILLKTLDSLKQFYSLTMDVHSRFRTEAHSVVKPRFNERFMLSLGKCETCVVVDDELNILPISKSIRDIKPLEMIEDENEDGIEVWNEAKKNQKKLAELKESLAGTQPACNLVALAKTVDQARAILSFIEAVADKSLASTVTLTAGRGRGKSAALGVSMAAALAFGYSNIFVTSPSPENLKTVFEFVLKGLDAIEYKEHIDYEIIQSTNPEFNKAIVRINVFHDHRQTIQYIDPQDSAKLAQAELVVIDEAAAIPLPVVKSLIGNYLVFMSSTINGYEGTGRSLSLKLIDQLRKNSQAKSGAEGGWRTNEFMYKKKERKEAEANGETLVTSAPASSGSSRTLREIELKEPIRYASGDPVEAWLNRTLCLDATDVAQHLTAGTPHPSDCELYAVDRDTLFSHHSVSEAMLQRIVSLFVASHYKNSPNDLQLLSDAPAHRLFVLLGPSKDDSSGLPDVLCVLQVSLEGGISKKNVMAQLKQGTRASGDLVPWTISQQFQDDEFARLDGARVVRISTHPGATRMGYGKRALELLKRFYQGELVSANTPMSDDAETFENIAVVTPSKKEIGKEKIKPRKNLPPLMVPLSDLRPPRLHYLSVSYGLTESLFKFWNNSGFRPVYLRQTANPLTGEFSCIMLNPLDVSDLEDGPNENWEDSFCKDFLTRFLSLQAGPFSKMNSSLSLAVASSAGKKDAASQEEMDAGTEKASDSKVLTARDFQLFFLPHDLKRLGAYSKNLVDFHMVTDLLGRLAMLFFGHKLPDSMSLSALQRLLLLGMGLQNKTVDTLAAECDLPVQQLLALFNKSIRKISSVLTKIQEEQVAADMEDTEEMSIARKLQDKIRRKNETNVMTPLNKSMSKEQEKEGEKVLSEMKKKQQEMLDELNLGEYAVAGDDKSWENALGKSNIGNGAIVSVKSDSKKSKKAERVDAIEDQENSRKKKKSFARSSGKKHKRQKK
mmetsp:Transcript_28071/g.45007  ORF Transcript_28071/g.45007 Transcript_28071/m.45007 type:complete len:1100 (+) Transcript_28071:465-3764(+)|eukprot:CAMPEP_0203763624 /NCGR_PEP_ID=MMETSP0098-20131031/16542_1 /ASSEMBLY_ACC=CAM_ASM_000208 /TAXON_ID=96639 /ORGANISM=" , Strain NY0313808BC1" /LENGTH=1099 /DNA_ID=CAMNT_0050658659 /DNA_START=518 /DNA_END=3817 /DNA_ORIENTATION=-